MDSKENKKFLFIIHSLHPGGMERVMSELLNEFSLIKDVELYLILYGIKREIFYNVSQKVNIIYPPFSFNQNKRLISTIKTGVFIRNKVKELSPLFVLSFGEIWNTFILISLFGLPIRVFISDRNQPGKSLGRIQDYLRKKIYPTSAGIIAQTKTAMDIFLSEFNHNNIKVIGNPIRKVEQNKTIVREKTVLSVGRLIESKHHDLLIRMFVNSKIEGWNLIIVGGEALKQHNMDKLNILIKSLGAEDSVELVGNRSDVDTFYNRSSIFAFTSSSEGFPNVIGEALSASLPVIAFDCIAGPSEMVIDGENGYLLKMNDINGFENKLKELMQNDILRETLSSNASKSISRFEKSDISNQFYKFLTKNNQ